MSNNFYFSCKRIYIINISWNAPFATYFLKNAQLHLAISNVHPDVKLSRKLRHSCFSTANYKFSISQSRVSSSEISSLLHSISRRDMPTLRITHMCQCDEFVLTLFSIITTLISQFHS